MYLPKCVLLCVLILTLSLNHVVSKRTFGGGRHSYPKSGGLSGGGHHSGGLSGGGHGYPSSGGSHGYPSSGGSHGYPSSGNRGGLSGSGGSQSHGYPASSGGSHNYPSSGSNSHGYPSSGNNHGYPSSGGGLSGNSHGYPSNNKPTSHHTTNVHNHYHYSPPAQISYASPRGGPPVSYPVYHGTPPTYVYQYKDSGSKYGTLLAGLALMNLGTLGVAAYAAHKANSNHGPGGGTYRSQPGEVCKFAIKKENGDYEETKIDCQIISSFIYQDMEAHNIGKNTTITTTTVTNVTMVNTTNVGSEQTTTEAPVPGNVLYAMLPNGTLVPVNTTGVIIPGIPGVTNTTQNETSAGSANNTSSVVSVTTTTTNTTLVSALDVKGAPVQVTPGMQCFVIRHSPVSNMKKTVPCGLLQTYAEKSIQRNSATRNIPMFTIVAAVLAYCVV